MEEEERTEEPSISDEQRAAKSLLSALWRSVDYDKFDRRTIWGVFERKVKSAAVQNIDLATFFEQAKRKLSISELSSHISEKDMGEILEILTIKNKKVLIEIREHTAICVLLVRLNQQRRREEYEQRKNLTIDDNEEAQKDERQQELQI